MKKFLEEFKEFALKGNIMDLAIAVIMGAAVNAIVTSLVANIISPLIGIFLGGLDFSTLSIMVGDAAIGYGAFIQSIIDFVITAFCIFLLMKGFLKVDEKLKPKEEKEEEKAPTTEELLTEIRDLLQQEKNA